MSRIPDIICACFAGYIAYLYINQDMLVNDADKGFAILVALIGIASGWKVLKNRGWILKLFGFPFIVFILLLVHGALSDWLRDHFRP